MLSDIARLARYNSSTGGVFESDQLSVYKHSALGISFVPMVFEGTFGACY
jgi:hypothetical protein